MFENVIVADGNAEIRYWFYEILSSLAYKVVCVPNSNELLFRLERDRPALVVLDEALPTAGGLETIRKIREFDTEMRIIILTASEPNEDEIKNNPLGITAALKKDFSNHYMMKRILELLKERKITASSGKRTGSILIVDDEVEIRRLLSTFLEKKGYEVTPVGSGEEALSGIKTKKPDLVLLDVRMPGMDGLMVLRNIKGIDESIKVIMLTAIQDKDIAQEAFREGARDYLVKPFDLHKLDAMVASILLPVKKMESPGE
ncbi:MAG: response regulator [Candidatus Omnitrophota bacterium]